MEKIKKKEMQYIIKTFKNNDDKVLCALIFKLNSTYIPSILSYKTDVMLEKLYSYFKERKETVFNLVESKLKDYKKKYRK